MNVIPGNVAVNCIPPLASLTVTRGAATIFVPSSHCGDNVIEASPLVAVPLDVYRATFPLTETGVMGKSLTIN